MDNETVIPLPVDLATTVQRLRSDLENVQRELDQALGVWRTSLINEKKEFQSLLQDKEKRWSDHEARIDQDRAAYEEKIKELEGHYKAQLEVVEQNALQALNELDDSWQRDKLQWNQAVNERVKTLEHRETLLSEECAKRDERVQELEQQLANPVVSAAPVVAAPAPVPMVVASPSAATADIVIDTGDTAVWLAPRPASTAHPLKTALELLEEQILALDHIVQLPADDNKRASDPPSANGVVDAIS